MNYTALGFVGIWLREVPVSLVANLTNTVPDQDERKAMTTNECLNFFFEIAPDFEQAWNSEHNFSLDENGEFDFHDICAEFSNYFIHQDQHRYRSRHVYKWYPTITDDALSRLFDWVEQHLQTGYQSIDASYEARLLADALGNCFLENIAQTQAGEYALDFMGPNPPTVSAVAL